MSWLKRSRASQAGQLIRSIPVMASRAGEGLREGINAASGATIRRFGPEETSRGRRRDPAPSRLRYRLERIWLTPLYRRFIRVGLPMTFLGVIGLLWFANEDNRLAAQDKYSELVYQFQHREEFILHRMEVTGASEVVEKGLQAMLPVALPASSFEIDLKQLREQVLGLDAVASVEFRIRPGGVLNASVTERVPVLLWRHGHGIDLIDETGHRVASVTGRQVRKDLPMISGEGADRFVDEALALIDAAGPVLPRLRGLERRGERRWDVVLDRGQRIMLPSDDPVAALKHALALARTGDMLARDVAAVDLRETDRVVLRMGLRAQNTIRKARGQPQIGPDGNIIEEEQVAARGGRSAG